jgi:hypothetical protein
MKKETIIAVIFGVTSGALIALFFIFTVRDKVTKSKKVIAPKIIPTINIIAPKMQAFEIIQPINGYLSDTNLVTINGKSENGSLIIIQSPIAEKIIKLEGNNFSLDFPLSLGENVITITIYQEKNIEEKTLKIYYLKE